MSQVNGFLTPGQVRDREERERRTLVEEREEREQPQIYLRLRDAMSTYRADYKALERVIGLCAGKNVIPTSITFARVLDEIERELARNVAAAAQTVRLTEKIIDGLAPRP
jgi:hypothetical protein